MAAALKYVLEARSNKHNNVYRVEIYEDGFGGSPTFKNIGAGHLKLTKKEGTIQQTTLFISIQADTDLEFTGFFQYNNFKYPVYLYKDGTKIGSYYLVAESYSEAYQNPPYDVNLVATDGLGFLQNYTFEETGTINKLYAIRKCLENTGLTLDFDVAVDLLATGMAGTETVFAQEYFDASIFEGEKCSDVLTKLFSPFEITITQRNNRWLIRRPAEDAEKNHTYYFNTGSGLIRIGTISGESVLTMGDLATGDVYPVGSAPLLEMEHAWKDAIIKKNYGKSESYFDNFDFSDGADNWTESPSGILSVVQLDGNYFGRVQGYVNPGTDDYIQNSIEVDSTTGDNFIFEVQFDGIALTRYTQLDGFSPIQVTIRMSVQLGSYWLTTNGWGTTQEIMEFPIESSVGAPNWKTIKIITDDIPASGTLIFKFYRIEHEPFPARSNSNILGSVLNWVKVYSNSLGAVTSIQNYTVDLLENAAEGGNTIELKPVSIPAVTNAKLIFANGSYLSDGTPTTTWVNNGDAAAAIEQVIAKQLSAYYGAARHRLTGTDWRGASLHLNAISQHSKNSNKKFFIESGEWNIIEDEFNLNWLEVAGSGSATATEDAGEDNGAVHDESTESSNGVLNTTILPNGLISGGIVTWIEDLDYHITAARYIINNTIYESLSTDFTLDPADATYDRIDVVAVNTDGEVVIITGTPAANPQKPQVDPASELELTFITVPATATEPPNVTGEVIYNENTEWTGTNSGPTVDYNEAGVVYIGGKSTQVSFIGNDDTLTWTAASSLTVADFETLLLFIRLKQQMLSGQYLVVKLLLSGADASDEVLVEVEKLTVDEWQSIGVLLSEFFLYSDTFDAVQFRWSDSNGTTDHYGFYMDLIQLQYGVNQPIPDIAHPPVTIAADSVDYLSINDAQVLTFIQAKLQETIDDSLPSVKTGWALNAIYNEVTYSWNDGNRTLTLTPVSGTYEYWVSGVKYTSSGDSIQISNDTGMHYVVYNGDTLEESMTVWNILADNRALVAEIFWNASDSKAIIIGAEPHTYTLPAATHYWQHTSIGTRYIKGLAVSQNGTDNWKIDVSDGQIADEDIFIDIANGTTDVFEQPMAALEAPKLYRSGTTWTYNNSVPSNIVLLDGSNDVYRNTESGGSWSLTAILANRYSAMWMIATNDINNPLFWVVGQGDSGNIGDADTGNQFSDMNFSGLPTAEFRVIARVLVKNIAGSPYYEIAQIDQLQNDDIIPGGDVTADSYVISGSLNTDTLILNRNNGLANIDITGFHDAVTIGSGSTAYLSLNGQELDFDPDALNIPEVPTGVNKDWIEFEFRDITAGSGQSYYLDIKATVPYNIDSVVLQSDDTMDDVAVKIGSTPVTWSGSITGIDVTTSITETDAYSGYSVAAGNAVTLVTSGTDGDPTLIRGKLNITRT